MSISRLEFIGGPEGSKPRANVSPDLSVASRVGVRVEDEPGLAYDINLEAVWNGIAVRYDVTRIELVQKEGGPAITSESLRAIPVQQLLREVLSATIRVTGAATGESVHLSNDDAVRLAAQGPKPETLLWAARIYRIAQIRLDPPTRAVADAFGIPHRTASHWVRLAKERGVID